MDLNDLNKVWEIKPLQMIGEDDARQILEMVAKQVQPIMRKHKWKVKVLSEIWCKILNCSLFWNKYDVCGSQVSSMISHCSPSNPSLLGLNIGGGAEVKLRLRRTNREWDFFHYEQILDTMLHELCHNEYGPHNADFYNLLDEIRKECEDLMAKGITGTGKGFDLPGRRLGGFSRQPPLSSLRQSALAAVESRARRGALLPSGPNRVGGDSSIKAALSPIQAAAMAAERRLHDDLWCGSKSLNSGTDLREVIGSSTDASESSKTSTVANDGSDQTSSLQSTLAQKAVDVGQMWQCKTCTLLNQPVALTCEACGTKSSKNVANFKVWSCKFCTLDNSNKSDRCIACGEWRYSYGPPISSRGPYLGT